MKNILLQNPVSIQNIKEKNGISGYKMVNISIGYDDSIYILFSEKVPERIAGMFVNTHANTRYAVIRCIYDWMNEELIYNEYTDLGFHEIDQEQRMFVKDITYI